MNKTSEQMTQDAKERSNALCRAFFNCGSSGHIRFSLFYSKNWGNAQSFPKLFDLQR